MAEKKTKIDIFSGFLGAGKTTLIKKLINHIILLHHYVSLVIVLLNICLDCPDKHKHCL